MASGLSLVFDRIFPVWRLAHDVTKKGARVSGKDRSLHGKARVKARKAKNKIGGW